MPPWAMVLSMHQLLPCTQSSLPWNRCPPEQRKQATILFADVSGFTAMSETLDAEEVSDVMNALWQRWDAAIVEHGGVIDKHMGDGVMAVWGAWRPARMTPNWPSAPRLPCSRNWRPFALSGR